MTKSAFFGSKIRETGCRLIYASPSMLVLPDDSNRMSNSSPEPFATASLFKKAGLKTRTYSLH